MLEPIPWRRRWRVTLVRGVVAFAVLGVFAAAVGGDWPMVVVLAAVPALWLVPVGALVDHYLSRWGATLVGLLHLGGCVAAFFVWLAALTVGAAVTDQPLGGPLAGLLVVAVPPLVAVGFAVAWLVPGSFPRKRGLVYNGARWLRRTVARASMRADAGVGYPS